MNNTLLLVIIAGVASGLYQVLNKLIPQTVHSSLGAVLLSASAVVFGLFVLFQNIGKVQLVSGYSGVVFAILAGACVFVINFFAQTAYKEGLPISVGAPVIIGVSLVIAAIAGLLLGEKITMLKTLAFFLILVSSYLLTRH